MNAEVREKMEGKEKKTMMLLIIIMMIMTETMRLITKQKKLNEAGNEPFPQLLFTL